MPAKSKQQQRFMGMVLAYKKGELPSSQVSKKIREAAEGMTMKEVEDFAETDRANLPYRTKKASRFSKAEQAFMKFAGVPSVHGLSKIKMPSVFKKTKFFTKKPLGKELKMESKVVKTTVPTVKKPKFTKVVPKKVEKPKPFDVKNRMDIGGK